MSKSLISWDIEDWDIKVRRRKVKRQEEIEWKQEAAEQLEEWENKDNE